MEYIQADREIRVVVLGYGHGRIVLQALKLPLKVHHHPPIIHI
jgi:hypothetical protein